MSDPKDLLAELALGTLSPDEAADVQAYLADHPEARTELATLRETVADLAVALDPVEPAPALRARLLDSVAAGGRFADFTGAFAKLFDVATDRARELLDLIDDAAAWVAGPGTSQLVHFDGGPAVAGNDNGFVRVPPSTRFPNHEHLGQETVLILQGSATDSDGRVYRRGDVITKPAGSTHWFETHAGPDFVYAVTVGGVNFAVEGGDPSFTL